MPQLAKIVLFLFGTAVAAWVSRPVLHDPRHHGFYRFFAWEAILLLLLLNVEYWFVQPFTPVHLLSWAFLVTSLALIFLGARMFRRNGRIDPRRADPGLVGIEKTTELVTSGIYHFIRHPFYSSLLFLAWGILLKHVTWAESVVALIATIFLVLTARKEESENLRYFGEKYRVYMRETRMFVPYLF